MDNQRLYLFIALSLVIMLLFSAWQEDNAPKRIPSNIADSTLSNSSQTPKNVDMPSATDTRPTPSAAPDISQTPGIIDKAAKSTAAISSTERKDIRITTDLLDVTLDSKGGDIQRVALRAYPKKLKNPNDPVMLFDDRLPNLMITQSGLLSKQGAAVNHHQVYQIEKTDYVMSEGQDSIDVSMTWQSGDGFNVTKIVSFKRDSYVIDINYRVQNNTGKEWKGSLYRQIQRTKPDESDQSSFIYTYTGAVVSDAENKYEKIEFDDMAEWRTPKSFTEGGWAAMIQHYFLGAIIPTQTEFNRYYTNVVDQSRYIIGLQSGEIEINNGETKDIRSQYYIGPKEQHRLDNAAPNLRLAVDFGILTILAEPLFWLLDNIHDYIGNWGFAIIFVTLIVKLIFYKLSEAAYRSMANMRKFQPKIQQLRERYGNDKQKMSQGMMDLYKKEKINPLGGCLPMLVQIPVFISLYWVLLESVELRQADFMLWLDDLSAKDPFYVLPLLMGVSMFIQQKLNPAPMDPMQAKILSFLPFIFTAFFAFFPSGLVLYWVVNNCLSILQQWYITRKIENAPAKT